MSGIPGSGDGQSFSEFDCLEQRIINTEREHDEEVRKSIRPEKWQSITAEMIGMEIYTNRSEIYNRAFTEGLGVIREEVGWDNMQRLFDMKSDFIAVVSNVDYDSDIVGRCRDCVQDSELDIVHSPEGNLNEPFRIPVDKSVISEIDEHYVKRSNMESSEFCRVVIGAGLSRSKYIGSNYEPYAQEMISSIGPAIDEMRSLVEREFFTLVSQMSAESFSPDEGVLDIMQSFVGKMEGEKKDYCVSSVENMVDSNE